MDNRKFTEQELIRREKYKTLVERGRDPFLLTQFERNATLTELKTTFAKFSKEELANVEPKQLLKTAGRIKLFREAGKKAAFVNIQDQDADIQLYVRMDELGEDNFNAFRDLDLGDIIGVEGHMMKTDHGELSIRVCQYTLLSKALKPLPDKHAGIQDIEEKYRRRYVDLIMNPEVKKTFQKRSKIVRALQKFLDDQGYMEVETPILQSVKGGAAAKPFKSYFNALDHEFTLRIATELPLKRLIVGGFEGVYEIGRLFRNEGMSARHNPEFTTLELYVAYKGLDFLMNINEKILKACNDAVNDSSIIHYGGYEIDLGKSFARVHMVDAIKNVTGVDFWKEMTFDEALAIAKKHHVKVEKHHFGVGHIINLFFEEFVEKTIIQPTFIYGHPVEVSPLSKSNKDNPRFTDRFELFIIGREYANAYCELNNPIEQYSRFEEQLQEIEFGNDEAGEMDIDFIEALEYGLPPTAGFGLGIDRMVMLLTNSESIKDVLLFPQMKPREGNN
ncbi:lysine--tRNA ligase [Williamsoniiplasma lucivorax]|uniref:Lysine--tRNA ligase n=1 Tax=Williamsoniiplasma lucivorax TaxID=209274 RepID=A0A2S5REY2_9MOLU|nr:lysine--tRNA ligase [Williamsoniiplasma lucivorax]PPE05874.1 lysyl-tRNA synthetase [Williamsoniiplasma lucivorax]